jgi:hypothetical protein
LPPSNPKLNQGTLEIQNCHCYSNAFQKKYVFKAIGSKYRIK